jgi:hypothetical protein
MAYNTGNSYNKEAEYAKKTLAELIAIREQFESAVADYPNGPKMFNEHLQWVKMKIAERIGKKQ